MMQTIESRINETIIRSGLNIREFAIKSGIAYGYLYSCIRGQRHANLEIVQRICIAFPEVDERWLLLGEGEMFSIKTISILRTRNEK